MMVTNVADLSAAEVMQRYRALADIERGFMALIQCRVMRQRLKLADSNLDPDAELTCLRRIQRHSVCVEQGSHVSGISTTCHDQAATMVALKVKKLSSEARLPLL